MFLFIRFDESNSLLGDVNFETFLLISAAIFFGNLLSILNVRL